MRAKVAFLVSAAFAPAAHAGFYVTDATAPVATRVASQPIANDNSTTYKVPFYAHSSQISWTAKRSLGAILTSLQDATNITISGCGETKGGEALAYRRGAAIKGWLIDNGISPDVVNVTADTDSKVIRSGKAYNCVIAATRQMTAYQQLFGVSAPAPNQAAASYAQPAMPTQTVEQGARDTAAEPGGEAQLTMIRQVLGMVKDKILTPENAVSMLQAIVKTSGNHPGSAPPQGVPPSMPPIYAPTTVQASAQPHMQYVSTRAASAPIVTPAVMPPPAITVEPTTQTWAFGDNQTLQDTLATWARDAGWKPPVWRASNPYRVSGAPVTGTFFDALRAICAAAPSLDIKADAQTHELIVTDAGH